MYDLVAIGRVNMDLFSRDIGKEFREIRSFDAMVGGSPANIALSSARLGLRSALLTAVGEDQVGDFVLGYLESEGVETAYIPRKLHKTSLALLGVLPPDRFPLLFYRDDPADIHLQPAEVERFPFADTKAFQLSGNALSRGVGADAAFRAAELAADVVPMRFVDLDLRPTEWAAAPAYGLALRRVFPLLTVIIGTEEETYAALSSTPEVVMSGRSLPPELQGELSDLIVETLAAHSNLEAVIVKRGPSGATIFTRGAKTDVAGFPVEVVNTVGAGDAFAGGLITARVSGWDWPKSVRFGNACGAIEVTRHGCSVAFPTRDEVENFVGDHGGW